MGEKRVYVFSVLTGMVITCDFPCTCILVLVKNRLYVLFVPNGAQWYMDPWSFGFMAKWIHGSLDSWHNLCMAVWIHGTMDEQQFAFIAQWMHSSLDSCDCGCVAVWMHGIFGNIPPRHLRPSKIKTHYVCTPSFTVKAQKLNTSKLSGD